MAGKRASVLSFTSSVDIPAQTRAKVNVLLNQQLGDTGTADRFTEVSRCADKYLYLLEAHLQG